MNGAELLRGVDFVARERQISKEVIFSNIEKAVRLAIQKCYDDEEGIIVTIDRQSGDMQALKGDKILAPEDLGRTEEGRSVAYTAEGGFRMKDASS